MLAAFPARAVFLQRGTITRLRHSPLSSPPMKIGSMESQDLLKLFRALNTEGVEYVVVGAVAMALHGLLRYTDDADLFVRPTLENFERLRAALRSAWDDPSIDEIAVDERSGEFYAIAYVPPDGALSMDFLPRLGEAFRYEDIESHLVPFMGVKVSVATPAALWEMKHATARAQDRLDASTLNDKFDLGKE